MGGCLLLLWLNVLTLAQAAATSDTPSHNTISGHVFIDTNVNHQADTDEQGLSRQTLVLYDIVHTTCISTRTDRHGYYSFSQVPMGNYRLYQAYGETIPTPQVCNPTQASAPLGYIAITDLVSSTLAFSHNSDSYTDYTDINFGVAKQPKFTSDNGGTVFPGNVIFYQHHFTAPADGYVTFHRDIDDPEDWSSLLYHDGDCDGRLTGTEANQLITAPLSTRQGDKTCLIHTVFAPESAQADQQSVVTITATFTYGNGGAHRASRSATQQLSNSDVTTAAKQLVVDTQQLQIHKTIQNLTQQTAPTETLDDAQPGDTLLYRITYRNTGDSPITMTELEIKDAVPAFSTLDNSSVRCEETPVFLTCATPHTANNPDLVWYFSGQLEAAHQGSVTFKITVE